MKILITGANGLLGQKLVAYCEKDQRIRCIATSKGPPRFQFHNERISYESLDITDHNNVQRVIDKHSPDVLINTAAITQVDLCEENKELCYQVNVKAVEYLTNSFRKGKSHFIHLSTDFIFDGTSGPYTETDKPKPVSYYGKCKLEAEKIVLGTIYESAVVRTILVYGITPNMSRSNIVLWVKKSLEKGEKIKVVNDQVRTPTLADDLAEGCLKLAVSRKRGVFNIGGTDTVTPYQLAVKVAHYYDLDPSLIEEVNASTFRQKATRPPVTGLIIDKAIKELNYKPHSLDEGLGIVDRQLKKYQLQ